MIRKIINNTHDENVTGTPWTTGVVYELKSLEFFDGEGVSSGEESEMHFNEIHTVTLKSVVQ